MIVLSRHFYTEANKNNIIQTTKLDLDILKIPWELQKAYEIEINSLALNDPKIYTSELKRTKQTAEALGYTKYKSDELLNEFDLYEYDGMSHDDFAKLDFNTYEFNQRLNTFKLIVDSVMHKLLEEDRDIIIFTHGIFIRYVICSILKSNLTFADIFTKISVRPLAQIVIDKQGLKQVRNLMV